MDDNKKYERAKKKVMAIKGFYSHLTVYVLVNIMLITINLMFSPNKIWFIFPLFGWGIGLVSHFISVFVTNKRGSAWEDKKIKEFMEKDDSEMKND